MSIRERALKNIRHILSHKRQYASYLLLVIGMAGLTEHLFVSGYTWDLYQHVTCHGFWLGIAPIMAAFLLGTRWRAPGKGDDK